MFNVFVEDHRRAFIYTQPPLHCGIAPLVVVHRGFSLLVVDKPAPKLTQFPAGYSGIGGFDIVGHHMPLHLLVGFASTGVDIKSDSVLLERG